MKTLYIHGLDSSPKPQKTAIIQAYSAVEALHLNYRKTPDSFTILSNLIVKEKISHIIGSSLGGFLGFWLAEKHSLPCLLFNPAIGSQSLELAVDINKGRCPKRLIVIGQKDDVVLPENSLQFLRSHQANNSKQRIVLCNNLGHQIDLDTFKEFTTVFFNDNE